MTVITYKDATAQRCAVEKVYLDGKLVGYVRKDDAGFYYEPLGRGTRGPSMPNTRLVHRSLEY
jgi:hypothetical protein